MLLRLLAFGCAASVFAVPAGAATLTLRLTGLDAQGAVLVALFDSESGFTGDRPVATAQAQPRGGSATVVFRDVEAGDYAVKSFQDGDGNGRISLNALGIPKEPYAFSNNARGRFGPPGWSKAAFQVGGAGARQTIRMN
jgi:uncharacterized protein (DUF2141 family)